MIRGFLKLGFLFIFIFLTKTLGNATEPIESDHSREQKTVKAPKTVFSSNPVNVIVAVNGSVSLKRPGWSKYASVVFGTAAYEGDLLRVSDASRATLVCSDITLHHLIVGITGVPCVPWGDILQRPNGSSVRGTRYAGPLARVPCVHSCEEVLRRPNGSSISVRRGWQDDESSPVVLSPRDTKLMTNHPTLRWMPVKGAIAYKVIVRGKNLQWSTVATSATELVYPQKAPALEAGIDYSLIVVADQSRTSDEHGEGLSFSLLYSYDKKTVLQEQRQIGNLGLPEGPTQFLIAHLYAGRGLYAEAIERLEGISQLFRVAAVPKLLGDLHIVIGLPRQAEADYLDSLALAEAENDEEGQMLLHKDLAAIYMYWLGNKEKADKHLNATLDFARKLGDASTANQAAKQLLEFKNTSSTN